MKNKYNFYISKLYLLISEHYQLKKCMCGRVLFWSFFQKKLSLKRQICTDMELLNPSQSTVVAHACRQRGTLWAEQLSQPSPVIWMGNPCSNSCRVFHFLEGKAQPCSTPALQAHPSLPSFSFHSSFGCPSAFSWPLPHPSSPSLARPCAALACSPLLLPLWAGAVLTRSPAMASDSLTHSQLSPLHSHSAAREVCQHPVRLWSSWVAAVQCFCFIMAPFHTPVQLTYPTVFHSS